MFCSENVTQTGYQGVVPRGVLGNSNHRVCVHSLMERSDNGSSEMSPCVMMDIAQY